MALHLSLENDTAESWLTPELQAYLEECEKDEETQYTDVDALFRDLGLPY